LRAGRSPASKAAISNANVIKPSSRPERRNGRMSRIIPPAAKISSGKILERSVISSHEVARDLALKTRFLGLTASK